MRDIILSQLSIGELESIIQKSVQAAMKEQTITNPSETNRDERLTRKELCQLYKISYPTLHSEMQKGLPYEKCGRKTLFRRVDVDKYFSRG